MEKDETTSELPSKADYETSVSYFYSLKRRIISFYTPCTLGENPRANMVQDLCEYLPEHRHVEYGTFLTVNRAIPIYYASAILSPPAFVPACPQHAQILHGHFIPGGMGVHIV